MQNVEVIAEEKKQVQFQGRIFRVLPSITFSSLLFTFVHKESCRTANILLAVGMRSQRQDNNHTIYKAASLKYSN